MVLHPHVVIELHSNPLSMPNFFFSLFSLCSLSVAFLSSLYPLLPVTVVVWDGIYVDFFYGVFGGLVLLLLLRPHWGGLYTQDKDVQDLGAYH
jgi:hypothetical protein